MKLADKQDAASEIESLLRNLDVGSIDELKQAVKVWKWHQGVEANIPDRRVISIEKDIAEDMVAGKVLLYRANDKNLLARYLARRLLKKVTIIRREIFED